IKKLMLFLLLSASPAMAGQLQISATGFTELPAAVNNTYSSFSDADFQRVLNWGKVAFAAQLPASPTNTQIWNAVVANWIAGMTQAEAQFSTTPAVPPTPINIH